MLISSLNDKFDVNIKLLWILVTQKFSIKIPLLYKKHLHNRITVKLCVVPLPPLFDPATRNFWLNILGYYLSCIIACLRQQIEILFDFIHWWLIIGWINGNNFKQRFFHDFFSLQHLLKLKLFTIKWHWKKERRQTANSNSLFMHSTDMHFDYAAKLTP